jgi:hypothetical protein
MGRHSAADSVDEVDDDRQHQAFADVPGALATLGRHSAPDDTEALDDIAAPDETEAPDYAADHTVPTEGTATAKGTPTADSAATGEIARIDDQSGGIDGPDNFTARLDELLVPSAEDEPDIAPRETAPISRLDAVPAESGTHADLRLLRERPRVRAWAAAAVVVPFVLYTLVMLVIGRTDVFVLWLWIPIVTAGVSVGAVLDVAHKRQAGSN